MLVILLLNQWFAASALASHSHFHPQSMPTVDMTECDMTKNAMHMSGMASDINQQTTQDMDCCEQDCSCPASAFSTAAVLNLTGAKLNINNSFSLLSYQFSSLTASISLLQKPPQA